MEGISYLNGDDKPESFYFFFRETQPGTVTKSENWWRLFLEKLKRHFGCKKNVELGFTKMQEQLKSSGNFLQIKYLANEFEHTCNEGKTAFQGLT